MLIVREADSVQKQRSIWSREWCAQDSIKVNRGCNCNLQ